MSSFQKKAFERTLRPPPLPSNVILNMPSSISSRGPNVSEDLRAINKENSMSAANITTGVQVNETETPVEKGPVKEIRNIFGDTLNPSIVVLDSDDTPIEISHTMKILIVGNAKCGKSSIIARYVTDTFQENYKTTIGADFVRKDLKVKVSDDSLLGVRLQLWDIAGQDRFQKMTRAYFSKAKGVVIVCDVSRDGTVDAVTNWKAEIDAWTQKSGAESIPVILFANKADLLSNPQDAFKTGAIMEKICREQGILDWWSTSARTGDQVNDGFALLVAQILEAEERQSSAAACTEKDTQSAGFTLTSKQKSLSSSLADSWGISSCW